MQKTWSSQSLLRLALWLSLFALPACAPFQLATYSMRPDYPRLAEGEAFSLEGLQAPVYVTRRADGLWRIQAESEADAARVEGYLLASDRMFQIDLFRHLARGEVAALLGDRRLGDKTTLETDILNRFLGFQDSAKALLDSTSREERQVLRAFVAGINAWIAQEQPSLEHRLLGVREVRPWDEVDSIAIYVMLAHSLSGNADREIRRLVIACEAGLDAVERVFPTQVEFGIAALPEEAYGVQDYRRPPAIAPEVPGLLPALCRQGYEDATRRLAQPSARAGESKLIARSPVSDFRFPVGHSPQSALSLLGGLTSLSASNNWVMTGPLSASGWSLLSGDPHLPHMNPPIVWGVEIKTPEHHVAGFTIPGLHRVVFGHNGHVAWSATTNHVDRQDLVLHRRRNQERGGQIVEGYDLDGTFVPFEYRSERFEVRGGESVNIIARFTRDGPLLNDIELALAGKIPLTSLRVASLGDAGDLDGARRINHSRNIADFIAGIEQFDQGCQNWVFGDDRGDFGYRSPCRVPLREHWRGTFPIPGWLSHYQWRGYVPKSRLPRSTNPDRGWLATANSDVMPPQRYFAPYNNDSSAPNRFLRIADRIGSGVKSGVTRDSSAAIQLDVFHQPWPSIRKLLDGNLCGAQRLSRQGLLLLCQWDGAFRAESIPATLFVLWSNAILDRALADSLPSGARGETWRYIQSLPQFESVAQWLWTRTEDDPIWDDATTARREGRAEILLAAFDDAVAEGRRRFGDDMASWHWGWVRPFVLRHPFAADDGVAGALLNSKPLHLGGDNETVLKQQFIRSDRERLNPTIGPVVRFTIDLADPWNAIYSLAGGESGWPASPYYGNLLEDWAAGRGRRLTPPPSPEDIHVRFVPAGA